MSGYEMGAPPTDDGSMVAQAQEKVQATAQQASGAAAKMMREQVESRASQASSELRSVATAMRRTGHSLHAEGNQPAAKVADTVTQRVESIAGYLDRTNGDEMLHHLESFGRRRPWMLIGAGLVAGLAASRFLKASSHDRYELSRGRTQAPQTGSMSMPPPSAPPAYTGTGTTRPESVPQTIGGSQASGW